MVDKIKMAIEEDLDIVSEVQEQMLSDMENDSRILLNRYNGETPEVREAMDFVLICLCGYSMESLIDRAEPMIY